MKAWVLHEPGDFRLEERPLPTPEPDEVLLEVKAAGICGSDIPRIFTTGAHVHPIVPGHEFSGIVRGSGDPALTGKRAAVFPLIPCQKCAMCGKRKYELCRHYSYLGSRRDGGFAEYVAVPKWNLLEIPDEVSFEEAALLEPLSVAIHAVRRAGAGTEDRAAVIGLGTIGLLTLAVLRSKGVKHIAVLGNKPFQRRMAENLGLSADNYFEDFTRMPEVDVVLECAGKRETVEAALQITAPEGRVVTVGNPGGDMTLAKERYWRILRNQLTVLGTWNSSFLHAENDDWNTAIRLLQKNGGMISRIITHRIPLDTLESGLAIMRDRKQHRVKILCLNG